MNKIRQYLKEKEYARFFLMFFSGTLFAQIITVSLSPFLTRIYSPSEFGLYGIYIAIVTILIVFVTGRYEYAINASNEKDAYLLFRLVKILSIITSLVIFFIILVFGDALSKLLNLTVSKNILFFIPLTLLPIGFLQATTYYLNRKKNFKILSSSKILQSLMNGLSSIVMGLSKFSLIGLILAHVIGVSS